MTIVSGVTLPAYSAPDPALAGEGRLDPLGLAAIADELADRLVPHVRARMSRIRFVTAMAVAAVVCEEFADQVATDGVSSPPICFEWLTIEAFVRRLGPEEWTGNIPGSRKAKSVVAAGGRLAATNYLKTPTVFGFHGIYQPLARSFAVVDRDLLPDERCGELVAAWQADQRLTGFFDAVPGSPGLAFRRQLERAVHDTLEAGRCAAPTGSPVFGRLADTLHPDRAGRRERSVVRGWLLDPGYPERAELADALEGAEAEGSERDLLAAVRSGASPGLAARIDAIDAYETLANRVTGAFESMQYASTSVGVQPLSLTSLADEPLVADAAAELPGLFTAARDRLEEFELADRLEIELGVLADPHPPQELPEVLIALHGERQQKKPPRGKRSWFERIGDGIVVRPPYVLGQPPALRTEYLHPYRVHALHGFMTELR